MFILALIAIIALVLLVFAFKSEITGGQIIRKYTPQYYAYGIPLNWGYCGDGVIQLPNSYGQHEECEFADNPRMVCTMQQKRCVGCKCV
jgi:hypothetical protein